MDKYKVDFTLLDNKRPIGVTGLMRVKNDGCFVSASIDSCIEALDELVIAYDDSEDNTEEVIKEKQRQYPDKIKLYHYEPQIYSHNLVGPDFDKVAGLNEDSVHLLSNYYNWTMSKATYRYAFKIDADQIYFTSKLKYICNLYRSDKNPHISISDHAVHFYYKAICKFFGLFPAALNYYTSKIFISGFVARKVQNYIYKRIEKDKIVTSFSGINLFCDNGVRVPMGKFHDGVQPPINGSGDHIFFQPSSKNKYIPWPQREYNRIIEVMSPASKMYFGGGFLWLHLNAMRPKTYEMNKKRYVGHTADIEHFLINNFFQLEGEYGFRISSFMRPIIYQSLQADNNTIKDYVSKYKKAYS